MSLEVIELCMGNGCPIAPYCHHYRYVESSPGVIVKMRLPTSPGEHCEDYQSKQSKRWGDGPEGND